MEKRTDKIRIKDIARKTGVSIGTVDRVLHNREGVSARTRVKVEAALKEMGYRPNPFAAALASKRHYTVAALLPKAGGYDYWIGVLQGVDLAAKEYVHLNIDVEQILFDQYDSVDFEASAEKLLALNVDAVLLAPIFKDPSIYLASRLDKRKIPYVFIDSDIEEANALSYFGMDSLQSGYLAAKLLLADIRPQKDIAIFKINRHGIVGSNQSDLRYQGFLKYVQENLPDRRLRLVMLHPSDDRLNLQTIRDFFIQYPHVKEGITFNSRVFRIAYYLEELQRHNFRLLGYELLLPNIKALKEGKIKYLLSQRPEVQGYRGMKALCDYKVFKKEGIRRNFMPIDILTAENIDYYTDFQLKITL
ncbi:MAG: LacI family DNA-binding transcriptional regulator [Porphyromonadaceae bacterium]|nr:LacI family DNA-binding transcriptional regulator [Porphyromonadaceae bacterium]